MLRGALCVLCVICCECVVCGNCGELSLECRCGTPPPPASARIVNGQETRPHEFPWMAAIRVKTFYHGSVPSLPFCGGTLISDQHVITAAHCLQHNAFKSPQYQRVEVVLGLHWARYDTQQQIRQVRRAVVMLAYNSSSLDYDVAVLELTRPVTITPAVMPVCLPQNADKLFERDERPMVIALGWGQTSLVKRQSEVLRKSQWMQLMRAEQCVSVTRHGSDPVRVPLTSRMLCAVSDSTDACLADSGGPLLYYDEDLARWLLVAVTSYGWGCNRPRDPGVYASLLHEHIQTWLWCANTGAVCAA